MKKDDGANTPSPQTNYESRINKLSNNVNNKPNNPINATRDHKFIILPGNRPSNDAGGCPAAISSIRVAYINVNGGVAKNIEHVSSLSVASLTLWC